MDSVRERPWLALGTVIPCSAPLGAGLVLAVHVIRQEDRRLEWILGGAVVVAALFMVRSIGWGAAVRNSSFRESLAHSLELFTAQALPQIWGMVGVLLVAAPIVLAVFASNLRGNPFASAGLAVLGSAFGCAALALISVYVSRRMLAVHAVAQENLSAALALRRSRELILGHTVRALCLQAALIVLWAAMWGTLVVSIPALLWLGQLLTGLPLTAVAGLFSVSNPTYLLFQAAATFVLLDPIRCFVGALLYVDCRVRREGADLKGDIEAWAAKLKPTEARR